MRRVLTLMMGLALVLGVGWLSNELNNQPTCLEDEVYRTQYRMCVPLDNLFIYEREVRSYHVKEIGIEEIRDIEANRCHNEEHHGTHRETNR